MTQEQKSLWRIKNSYIDEAASEEERVLWKKLAEDKENHIKDLREAIKTELNK